MDVHIRAAANDRLIQIIGDLASAFPRRLNRLSRLESQREIIDADRPIGGRGSRSARWPGSRTRRGRGPEGVGAVNDRGPSMLAMVALVAVVVALVILVFFALGYAFGRAFL